MATLATHLLVVVTGGSSGIGLELAQQLISNGFDVVIAVDPDANEVTIFGGTAQGDDDEDVAYVALLRPDAQAKFWDGEDRPIEAAPDQTSS